jgi:hypothetical protein
LTASVIELVVETRLGILLFIADTVSAVGALTLFAVLLVLLPLDALLALLVLLAGLAVLLVLVCHDVSPVARAAQKKNLS